MKLSTSHTDYSIRTRLLVSVSVLLFITLGLTGIVLARAFEESERDEVDDLLQLQIYALLAVAEQDDGEFYLEALQEPRFRLLNSGLYAFISSPTLQELYLYRSPSSIEVDLVDPQILLKEIDQGEFSFSRAMTIDDRELFVATYSIRWEDGERYYFTVMESTVPYYSEVHKFRVSLLYGLGGVAGLLLILQLILMGWGLAPLNRLAVDLKAIEVGDSEQLIGIYPKELQGVTANLNLLIKSERKQQGRYRTTLGDLAHSLKTPLAVISGIMGELARDKEFVLPETVLDKIENVDEQISRMNQIVTYQLQRAVKSIGTISLARTVNVKKIVDKILKALDKVYVEKAMLCETKIDEQAVFPGDERDLMEVLGNVLDNAYKYGRSHLSVSVTIVNNPHRQLRIVIEDDGPGISHSDRQWVMQRGARADTLASGQGIGLAVVTDIVSSYGGTFAIQDNESGGALIKLMFDLEKETI